MDEPRPSSTAEGLSRPPSTRSAARSSRPSLRGRPTFGHRPPHPTFGHPAFLVAWALLASFTPAIGEELLFRGYVQGGLMRRWKAWPSILVMSVVFSAAHFWPGMLDVGGLAFGIPTRQLARTLPVAPDRRADPLAAPAPPS